MTKENFMQSVAALREVLMDDNPGRERAIAEAYWQNPWFIPEFSHRAINAIAENFLKENKIEKWLRQYSTAASVRKVGITMAGNIPLVGFHDLLCVLAAGHHAIVKLSDKDNVLLKYIIEQWGKSVFEIEKAVQFTEKLVGYDAVIATGSNNSARYFEYYFRDHPKILRRNRNGVALLTGEEHAEDLQKLGEDIFLYFGLGCRNVSKIYVPYGYDFSGWNDAMREWKYLAEHNKYKNNLDYNYAIYIINQVPHIQLGHLILKEDSAIASRIGCVHFEYYDDIDKVKGELQQHAEEIQCLVSKAPVDGWEHVPMGSSQQPSLEQYADGVDTMQFLSTL